MLAFSIRNVDLLLSFNCAWQNYPFLFGVEMCEGLSIDSHTFDRSLLRVPDTDENVFRVVACGRIEDGCYLILAYV